MILEDSTSNEENLSMRGCEEEASSDGIFKRRDKASKNEESQPQGTIGESSSNKENEVFLKASYEEDDYEVTNPSYKQLFKISPKLIEENDRTKNVT